MAHHRPDRRLGQNFLVDRAAVARIVAAAGIGTADAVLEIGPGRGALTEALIDCTGRIAAVEIDPVLAEELTRRFDASRLVLLRGDVLELGLSDVLAALGHPSDARLVVVGNLPYNISKPLALRLVEQRRCVARAILMFQREVADRLTAVPGSRNFAPLGVLAGEAFRIERLFDLRPGAFRPRPRVDSTVTRWNRRTPCTLDADDTERRLRACLTICFAHRRRTLRNNLRAALGDGARVDALLARAGLDGSARAESLEPAAFLRLAACWEEASADPA